MPGQHTCIGCGFMTSDHEVMHSHMEKCDQFIARMGATKKLLDNDSNSYAVLRSALEEIRDVAAVSEGVGWYHMVASQALIRTTETFTPVQATMALSEEPQRREGAKVIHTFEKGVTILGMINYGLDQVIATSEGAYILKAGVEKLAPIDLKECGPIDLTLGDGV